MDKRALSDLVCPNKKERYPCGGRLSLFNYKSYKKKPNEVREGIVRCKICGEEFPILEGILILMDEVKKYLRKNYYYITGLCRAKGMLSRQMDRFIVNEVLKDLNSPKEELFPKQQRYNRVTAQNRSRATSPYLCNHYDNLANIVEENDPFYDFIKGQINKDPHTVIEGLILRHKGKKADTAIEIGCSVGGLTARLANHYKFVYGIDNSFPSLFFARQILKHKPKSLGSFRVYKEIDDYYIKKINVSGHKNVEFICASGESLPFRDESMSLVCSCNLIELVPDTIRLLKEKIRILKKGGLFAISDPYEFQEGITKGVKGTKKKPAIRIVRDLISKNIKIREEIDNIPWVRRNYRRGYEVYFNHTFVGLKDAHKKRRI